MGIGKLTAALVFALGTTACTSNKVIFVTSSALGINLDTTPGTVAFAYDRTEGYAAPAYKSGTLPPVMASIDTDGTPLSPKIRQLYATGAAARIVAGDNTATEPADMTHRNGRMAFVGTTTTLGLKAAFTTGPESVSLGYKRKEFSYIPLGCQNATEAACTEAQQDLYPSVIASYDTTIDLPSASGTSLKTRQFVATGQAAAALAPHVAPDFRAVAKESVAFQAGRREAALHIGRIDKVAAYVSPNGVFEPVKLQALVDTANATAPGAVYPGVRTAGSVAELKSRIGADQRLARALEAAIPQGPNN